MDKIIYASFIRFPAEKAHSLYVAKVCEAFVGLVTDVRLVVPRRIGVVKKEHADFYNLRRTFPVTRLPCIDLLWLPFGKALAHKLGLITFGLNTLAHLWLHTRKDTWLFSNDALVALLASFSKVKVVYEVHDYPTGQWWFYHWVGRRVDKLQTNNQHKVALVVKDFKVPAEKVYCAYNGVTIEDFDIGDLKEKAREKLSLDQGKKYAVYTGHLYDWKGARVLAEAAKYMPEVDVLFVGGTDHDVRRMKQEFKEQQNVYFLGHKPHQDIPLYLKAADVLVLPNSGQHDLSLFHTSPMKFFEYMASDRPIIASDIPSIREIVDSKTVVLVEPDNPQLLAKAIKEVCQRPEAFSIYVTKAKEQVNDYTWDKRVTKIISTLSIKP